MRTLLIRQLLEKSWIEANVQREGGERLLDNLQVGHRYPGCPLLARHGLKLIKCETEYFAVDAGDMFQDL